MGFTFWERRGTSRGRIDNQLRGRAGRQGDPGSLPVLPVVGRRSHADFGGGDREGAMQVRHGRERLPIESGMVSRAIERAKNRSSSATSTRSTLLECDDVNSKQRRRSTGRRDLLEGKEPEGVHDRQDADFRGHPLDDLHRKQEGVTDWEVERSASSSSISRLTREKAAFRSRR